MALASLKEKEQVDKRAAERPRARANRRVRVARGTLAHGGLFILPHRVRQFFASLRPLRLHARARETVSVKKARKVASVVRLPLAQMQFLLKGVWKKSAHSGNIRRSLDYGHSSR